MSDTILPQTQQKSTSQNGDSPTSLSSLQALLKDSLVPPLPPAAPAAPAEPEAPQQSTTSIDELIAEIQAKKDKHELRTWVIDNVTRFLPLGLFEFAKLKAELLKGGLPTVFVDRDLKSMMKLAKDNAAGTSEQPEQESLWEKCIADLTDLGYTFRMNELDDRVEVNGQYICDGIEAQMIMEMYDKGWVEKGENGAGGSGFLRLAWTAEAHQRRYNPVKEFLDNLVGTWDGVDRISQLGKYIKDKHPQIVYQDGRTAPVFDTFLKRWGIGAVGKALRERVQNPMFVFDGAQDAGKSTLARFLCPMGDNYHIESHISPDNNDHQTYLATKLVWEVAELGATTRKADRESLKAFLTRVDVTFRTPYAHHPVTKPAIASFVGTINPEIGFLSDPTGHRRFLPVEIASIDFAYKQNVDPVQLWAQFVALYRAGEPAKLQPEEKAMADSIRMGHEIEDHYAGFILKYYTINLNKATPSDDAEWSVTTVDIVDQLGRNGVMGANTTNVGLSLVKLGLTKRRPSIGGERVVRWYGLKRNSEGVGGVEEGAAEHGL